MNSERKKYLTLLILCLGGGIIYQLPFLREAFYIPLQDSLELTHTQFGNLVAVYGIVSLFLYIPGGIIADRFSAKVLIPISFIVTGLTGIYFSTFPSYAMSLVVHIIWAFTTIFTFWPMMIKTVKLLGDSSNQGKLFGFFEGGRALVTTLGAFSALAIFKYLGASSIGIVGVLLFYSILLIVLGVIAFFIFEKNTAADEATEPILRGMTKVLKMPTVWLASMIIFCTYSITVALSYFTPYMTNILSMSVSTGALIGIILIYVLRIGGGPLGGIIVDKMGSATKYLSLSFIGIFIFTIGLLFSPNSGSFLWITLSIVVLVSMIAATMRGVYFVPLDEIKTPTHLTGVAAGVLSLVGFLPDTFLYTLYGYFLDQHEGILGYQYIFASILVLCVIGGLCAIVLYKLITASETSKVKKEKVVTILE